MLVHYVKGKEDLTLRGKRKDDFVIGLKVTAVVWYCAVVLKPLVFSKNMIDW
jgi:hypothetical protein